MWIKKFFSIFFSILQTIFVMVRYNKYTIAKYFRKQGAQIGEGCAFQVFSLGMEPYLISIGNNVWVSSGVIFHTHDGAAGWVTRRECPDAQLFGKIVVEDNCFIGVNAQLFRDVRIGENSIVGAGSVVITDVKPNSIVMGIPARVIGSTTKYIEKSIKLWEQQKPPDYKNIDIDETQRTKNYIQDRQLLKDHLLKFFK